MNIEDIHPVPEQPKYAPFRLFREGDIVEIDTHGRDIAESMEKAGVELGKRYTVTEDEGDNGRVSFIGDDGIEHNSMFFWLKLVTPVEEQGPFEVECDDDDKEYSVTRLDKFVCTFPYDPDSFYTKEQAKAAAEAERDRLNAKHRKEMKK